MPSNDDKLTPEQRQQAERLFHELDDLAPDSRLDALTRFDCEEAVRDVIQRRLSSIQITLLDSNSGDEEHTVTNVLPPSQYTPIKKIGSYTIKRLIGAGGMGQVFEAIQEHPRRSVALKVMRSAIASEAGRRRFEYEVQILGRLRHPNIAQIYDADVWNDGGQDSPYFVMEYVSGKPIDEHIKESDLDLEGRLELFLEVCHAISHGHQRGIIHRDLKPGNILVDISGHAKVIDFGVARATDSDLRATEAQTAVGQLIGTLQYMSPEQCAADPNDIDIRSDVYALGVVLFELLSDRLPYDLGGGGIPEAVRVIREKSPTRLTTLNETIPRDIEVIIGKALEKDRASRYRSAGDLGDDIRRFLDDEAIIARPPALTEHIRRYARKNRAAASAVVIVAITLIVSVIAIIYFAIVADEQRGIAQRETIAARAAEAEAQVESTRANANFQRLRGVFGDLFGDLLIPIRNLEGGMEARELLVRMGREHIKQLEEHATEGENAELLQQLARSHEAMGDLLGGERTANLGRPEEALQEFEEAARVWRMTPTENRTRVIAIGLARVLRKQADLLSYSDPERSMRLIQDARQRLLPVFDANPEDTEVLRGFYLALESQGNALCEGEPTEPRLTQALALFVEHRDLALRIATAHPKNMVFARDTALALRKIGWTRAKLGQRTEAEAAYRTSLARLEANAAAAPEHVRHGRDVSWGCWFLSETVLERGGTDEGATLLVRCAAMIVTTCVREPSSADYRTDVGKLVPAACEVLLEITRAEMAESVRRDALVRLQPVLEASPDNLALSEVLRRLRAIEAASARKSG